MQNLNVLVADDFEPFRAGFMEVLHKCEDVGTIWEAKDGLEAVVLAKHCRPDLVFLDISMPTINGLEAARQIRTSCPAAKIIFVTVHQEMTYHVLADMLDADGYLRKDDVNKELPGLLNRLKQPLMEE